MKAQGDPDFLGKAEGILGGAYPSEVIKENSARAVRRISVPGLPVYYVKEFRARGPAARLRRLFRDRARHEYRILEHLRAAGIPAPRPVAWGVADGRSFVATEEIPGTRVLRDAVERPIAPAERRSLLAALGRFVRRVHDAGVRDDDFHLGNILFTGPPSEPVLHLIDVHRAELDDDLSASERARGLGFLLHSLHTFFGPADQVRFLEAYHGGRVPKARLLDVREEFEAARERYARSRSGRCLSTGSGFQKSGGLLLRRPLEPEQARAILRAHPIREVKAVGRRRLWLVDAGRFVREDPKARAIWRNAHALEVRHVPTPRLWALEGRLVLGEWIADADTLDRHIAKKFPGAPVAQRRDFLGRLARFVRGLHANGVYHHDLKANNVLVRERKVGPEFLVIDVDRVTFYREVPLSRRLHNLAQLNAALPAPLTVGDRLAFYRAYAGWNRAWTLEWKPRVRRVMRATIARGHRWPAGK